MRNKISALMIIMAILLPALIGLNISDAQITQILSITPIDASFDKVYAAGEATGSLYDDLVDDPWYSDTAAYDPVTGSVVAAWVRRDVDLADNDYIYALIMAPVDTDGDSVPDAYSKTILNLNRTGVIRQVDSITIGGDRALITWTYVNETTGKDSVGAAIVKYTYPAELTWTGVIASDTYYNEFSRSCFVGSANEFLIVWYSSDGAVVKGVFVTPTGDKGDAFVISDTNNLYYKKADQMLCIGGNDKVLVGFRKWDSSEYAPDIYVALVSSDQSVTEIQPYDYNGEQSFGVRGAYLEVSGEGYFVIPFLSGPYVGYAVIAESDGSVVRTTTYPGQGTQPYVIGGSDRAVMAWVGSNGEIKVGNINPGNWYIYIASLSDTTYAYHPIPLLDTSAGKILVAYTGGATTDDTDVRAAVFDAGTPSQAPSLETGYPSTLVGGEYNQSLVGLAGAGTGQFAAFYIDFANGERGLMAYVVAPDKSSVGGVSVYELPADADTYKQAVINLIQGATSEIVLAMAFWDEGPSPCDTPGTIANALASKASDIPVYVIVDNDADSEVKTCLANAGVNLIDDSSAPELDHIMHNKFMVVDSSKVLVATVNFITSDFSKNNNTAIIIESPAVAKFYRDEFFHMWAGGSGRFGTDKTEDHSFMAFTTYSGRDIVIEAYFAPQNYGLRTRLPDTVHAYIMRASSNVRFSAYIFTTSYFVKPVYDAIVSAHGKGLDVTGVFDELLNVDTPGRRLYWFLDAGVPVAIDNHPYSMHAKLFTVDDHVAVIGSWNPTYSGTARNDENILVIKDSDPAGIAAQIGNYIKAMYSDAAHFVQSPYQYTPTHPVITKVMYYPDTSGSPQLEWVEIYNPLDKDYSLANHVIGDAENMLDGDDEGMYRFPDDAAIGPHSYVIVAYDAQAFEDTYGFQPTYEIAGTDPSVPDLTPYDTDKFTGPWNLDDTGDEVILAYDSYGFLKVIDAVWYGDSPYMSDSYGRPNSASPLDTSSASPGDGIVNKYVVGEATYLDALLLSDKYSIIANPEPVPEPWWVALLALATAGLFLLMRKYFSSNSS